MTVFASLVSTPVVNVALLREAVEWAEAEWEKGYSYSRWHQAEWISHSGDIHGFFTKDENFEGPKDPSCGTCFCIAGYVVSTQYEVTVPSGVGPLFVSSKGQVVNEMREATALLGLDETQARRLFAGSNSIQDIRQIAEEIAGQPL